MNILNMKNRLLEPNLCFIVYLTEEYKNRVLVLYMISDAEIRETNF